MARIYFYVPPSGFDCVQNSKIAENIIDGNILVAAASAVYDGYSPTGAGNAFVVDITQAGHLRWVKLIDRPGEDSIDAFFQTSTGDIYLSDFDNLLVFDFQGNVRWARILDVLPTRIMSIQETSAGDLLLSGYHLYDPIGSDRYASKDLLLMKMDSTGTFAWQTMVGVSSNAEGSYAAMELDDGSIVAVGESGSSAYVVSSDSGGETIATAEIEGSMVYDVWDAILNDDGTIIVAGRTFADGESSDIWVAKINRAGGLYWQKSYGGPDSDAALSIDLASDGNVLLAGYFGKNGAGGSECIIMKLDTGGGIIWQTIFDEDSTSGCHSIVEAHTGYVFASGYESSYDYDHDVWYYVLFVIKMRPDGRLMHDCSYLSDRGTTASDTFASRTPVINTTPSFSSVLREDTGSIGVGDVNVDVWGYCN
jgi:hypothetical protein